mmetsp:Transcript_16815/g.25118  ORF Transcript_16815/g.25118 Transcript_16815/m.25118 type:complete len:306 (-) Transcript_16815:76-993(-)
MCKIRRTPPSPIFNRLPKLNRKTFYFTKEVYSLFTFFLLLIPSEELEIKDTSVLVSSNLGYFYSTQPTKFGFARLDTYEVRDNSMSAVCSLGTVVITDSNQIQDQSPLTNASCSFEAPLDEWLYDLNTQQDYDEKVYPVLAEKFDTALLSGVGSANLTCAGANAQDPIAVVCNEFKKVSDTCFASSEDRREFNAIWGACMLALLPFVLWSSVTKDFLGYAVIIAWGIASGTVYVEDNCTRYSNIPVGAIASTFGFIMIGIKIVFVAILLVYRLPLSDLPSKSEEANRITGGEQERYTQQRDDVAI